MIDPLILRGVHINLGAKGAFVDHIFCTLINDGTLLTRERYLFRVIFQEILANFWANFFK